MKPSNIGNVRRILSRGQRKPNSESWNRLPVELVWTIFGFAWEDKNGQTELKQFLKIIRVCPQWRAVAFEHTSIQQGIDISAVNSIARRRWISFVQGDFYSLTVDPSARLEFQDVTKQLFRLFLSPLPLPIHMRADIDGKLLIKLRISKPQPAKGDCIRSVFRALHSMPNLRDLQLRLNRSFFSSITEGDQIQAVSLPYVYFLWLGGVLQHHAAWCCKHIIVDRDVLSSTTFDMIYDSPHKTPELLSWIESLRRRWNLPPIDNLHISVNPMAIGMRGSHINRSPQTMTFNIDRRMCFYQVLTALPLKGLLSLTLGPFDRTNCRLGSIYPFEDQPALNSFLRFLYSRSASNLRQLTIREMCSHQPQAIRSLVTVLEEQNERHPSLRQIVLDDCELFESDYLKFTYTRFTVTHNHRWLGLWNFRFDVHEATFARANEREANRYRV